MQRHHKAMKKSLSFLIAAFGIASCDYGPYCTMEFRTVGFTWTSTSIMPDSIAVTNIRTGARIRPSSEAFNQFYPVADDNSMSQLSANGDSLAVEVFNDQDSLLVTTWYVVGKDDCHIIFHSGPEFLP